MGTTKKIETINPATEEQLSSYNYMTDDKVTQIIDASHEAFLDWKTKTAEERAEVIRAIGKELQNCKNDLAKLMTNEMGKLLKQSKDEIELCAAICNYTAENSPNELKDIERELSDGGKGIITFSPIGIVYGIQPWNYPAYQVIRYAIVNLMAGNSVLLKHAENVTGTGLLLESIFETAGLPKNLFRTVVITHEQSNDVIANDKVRGVTMTGSSGAGKKIGQKATEYLKKTVLELGSNDAYIVLEDADLDVAVKKCVRGRIYNNGETCIAAKRFIVVDAIYEEFTTRFVEAMKALSHGNPMTDDYDMGPMARKDLREKLHEQVKESVDNGAELLCGGTVPEGQGYYYPATVLSEVKKGQPAYDDELFGPVASVIKAKDQEDAFQIANDSKFGLGGGIFTKNIQKATELASKHFDTGMIFINSFGLAEPNMPFGGVKNSGYGREHGGFGLKEFVNVKSIMISQD